MQRLFSRVAQDVVGDHPDEPCEVAHLLALSDCFAELLHFAISADNEVRVSHGLGNTVDILGCSTQGAAREPNEVLQRSQLLFAARQTSRASSTLLPRNTLFSRSASFDLADALKIERPLSPTRLIATRSFLGELSGDPLAVRPAKHGGGVVRPAKTDTSRAVKASAGATSR